MDGENDIVTAVLALLRHDARNPPDGRVIKQQPFDGLLQKVDKIVEAANVREFMNEEIFELLRRHAREESGRHENHGA